MPKSSRVRAADSLALSGADRAFLAWESPLRPMHVGLVATFRAGHGSRVPSLERVRAAIDAGVQNEPRLQGRLVPGSFGARERLVPSTRWSVDQHVRGAQLDPADSPNDFDRKVDALLASPLDRRIPLWEIWYLPGRPDPDCFTLLCKFHHALLDGASGVALIERFLGGIAPRRASAAAAPARPPRLGRRGVFAGLRANARLLGNLIRRGPATPLNGAVREERRHRSVHCKLETLDAGAGRRGGTRNDALLAAVAGAIRSSLDCVAPTLRVFCPVNLRRRGDGRLGNQISLWILDLPVEEPDLDARIRRVREVTRRAKRKGDAAGGRLLERLAAGLGVWTARLGMAVAAWLRVYQIVVTNMPGPARELSLLGARLESLMPFAPLFPGQRVAVAAITYAGRLQIGISDGFDTRELGDRIANSLARELDAIAAHADLAPPVLQRSA